MALLEVREADYRTLVVALVMLFSNFFVSFILSALLVSLAVLATEHAGHVEMRRDAAAHGELHWLAARRPARVVLLNQRDAPFDSRSPIKDNLGSDLGSGSGLGSHSGMGSGLSSDTGSISDDDDDNGSNSGSGSGSGSNSSSDSGTSGGSRSDSKDPFSSSSSGNDSHRPEPDSNEDNGLSGSGHGDGIMITNGDGDSGICKIPEDDSVSLVTMNKKQFTKAASKLKRMKKYNGSMLKRDMGSHFSDDGPSHGPITESNGSGSNENDSGSSDGDDGRHSNPDSNNDSMKLCGKSLEITYHGQKFSATIGGFCEKCHEEDLGLPEKLFSEHGWSKRKQRIKGLNWKFKQSNSRPQHFF